MFDSRANCWSCCSLSLDLFAMSRSRCRFRCSARCWRSSSEGKGGSLGALFGDPGGDQRRVRAPRSCFGNGWTALEARRFQSCRLVRNFSTGAVSFCSSWGGGGGGGTSSSGLPTATRGFAGTRHKGEEMKPAWPGSLGISVETAGGAGGREASGSADVSETGGGGGGAVPSCWIGRAMSGEEVKPQGFLESCKGFVSSSRVGGGARVGAWNLAWSEFHAASGRLRMSPCTGGGGGATSSTGISASFAAICLSRSSSMLRESAMACCSSASSRFASASYAEKSSPRSMLSAKPNCCAS
mmetsp:Transcript_31093/g.58322  ORF Transcript_31093/g.58322 Transcript_31093/m.58322 type:complete len:298 (-) Transcript_31093:526-1419(-)